MNWEVRAVLDAPDLGVWHESSGVASTVCKFLIFHGTFTRLAFAAVKVE